MSDKNSNRFQLKDPNSLVRKLIRANRLAKELHTLLSLESIGEDFGMERNDFHYYIRQLEKEAEKGGSK